MRKRTDRAPSPAYELDAQLLRQSMLRRLPKRLFGSSRLSLPAVPALLDHYVEMLGKLFALCSRPFTAPELEHLRGLLAPRLDEGFSASRNAYLIVEYQTDEPPKSTISYTISLSIPSAEQDYESSLKVHAQPRLQNRPACKVIELARSLGPAADVPVLEIGAGNGRNALALARDGFPADAAEPRHELAQALREAAAKEGLGVRLFAGDVLAVPLDAPSAHYRLVVASEVVPELRDVLELQRWFEGAAALLRPGGHLLIDAFLPVGGYQPDRLARELSFVFWSTIFLREELRTVAAANGLVLLSEEPVYEFEKARLPLDAWPPTVWFEEWTRGVDTFDLPPNRTPAELRWLTFRKNA